MSISAVTALAGVFLAGCNSGDDDSGRYCADRTTNTRVDDKDCDSGGARYGWYSGGRRPKVGGKVGGGSFTNAPPPPRGGFGGHGTSGGG